MNDPSRASGPAPAAPAAAPNTPSPSTAVDGAPPSTRTGTAVAGEAADEKTQPYRLRKVAGKLAIQRRRTTAATLVVKRPRQAEVRVPLDRSETVIGRDPRCDIVLQEASASRRHARIRRNDGGYFEVIDLGSRNGILVDNERVTRMTLMDGDGFVVGDTTFTIAVGAVVGADD